MNNRTKKSRGGNEAKTAMELPGQARAQMEIGHEEKAPTMDVPILSAGENEGTVEVQHSQVPLNPEEEGSHTETRRHGEEGGKRVDEQGRIADPLGSLQQSEDFYDRFAMDRQLVERIEEGLDLVMRATGHENWHEYAEWKQRMKELKEKMQPVRVS